MTEPKWEAGMLEISEITGGIIDAHCHIYPDAISRKAVEAVDRFYDGLPGDPYDGTVATLLREGRKIGVTHFVVHSVATNPGQVNAINRFIAGTVAGSDKSVFLGLGTLHPDSPSLMQDLQTLRDLNLLGVKLHPDIQRFEADSEKAMEIYEACQALDLPVLVHTGDKRYDYSNPSRIARILKAFPHLRMTGAHFGGWSVWDEAAEKLSGFSNFTVDTSSSQYWLGPERTRQLIHTWGVYRVMYGTDYPLWSMTSEIQSLLALQLKRSEYDRIFRQNAAEFYGLHTREETSVG